MVFLLITSNLARDSLEKDVLGHDVDDEPVQISKSKLCGRYHTASCFAKASAHAGSAPLYVSCLLGFEKEKSDFDVLHGDASDKASVWY